MRSPRDGLTEATKHAIQRASGSLVAAGPVLALGRRLPGTRGLTTTATLSRPSDPWLAEALRGRTLGEWTLSGRAIDVVAGYVERLGVRRALEFSSGVSTLSLAHFLRDTPAASIIAIEQEREHLEATRDLLERHGLAGGVALHHAPISMREMHGRRLSAYELPAAAVEQIGAAPIDLVLVDGPAAEDAARYSTLVELQPHLQAPAHFLLDDALRPGELDAAERWAHLPGFELLGYDLAGKGLLVGRVSPV